MQFVDLVADMGKLGCVGWSTSTKTCARVDISCDSLLFLHHPIIGRVIPGQLSLGTFVRVAQTGTDDNLILQPDHLLCDVPPGMGKL